MLKSMPNYGCFLAVVFKTNSPLRWPLLIFVAIAWTNLAGPVPLLCADEPLTPIPSINQSLVDHTITIQALVTAIREPSGGGAPYIVNLTQGKATLPLVYWPDVQPQLAAKVKVGNLIRAKVTVKLYRDHLELQISGPDAIDLVSGTSPVPASTNLPTETTASPAPPAPAPPQAPAVQTVIGKITDDWVGRIVVISGTISGIDNGNKSRRLSVQDATGEIQVLLGESQLASLHVDQLVPGRVLTITGPIKLLDGKRAIIPEAPGAVTLVL